MPENTQLTALSGFVILIKGKSSQMMDIRSLDLRCGTNSCIWRKRRRWNNRQKTWAGLMTWTSPRQIKSNHMSREHWETKRSPAARFIWKPEPGLIHKAQIHLGAEKISIFQWLRCHFQSRWAAGLFCFFTHQSFCASAEQPRFPVREYCCWRANYYFSSECRATWRASLYKEQIHLTSLSYYGTLHK